MAAVLCANACCGPARLNHLGIGFGYHPVHSSLVALASSSVIVISYSRIIIEIPSCKAIHCEKVCLWRSPWRSISTF